MKKKYLNSDSTLDYFNCTAVIRKYFYEDAQLCFIPNNFWILSVLLSRNTSTEIWVTRAVKHWSSNLLKRKLKIVEMHLNALLANDTNQNLNLPRLPALKPFEKLVLYSIYQIMQFPLKTLNVTEKIILDAVVGYLVPASPLTECFLERIIFMKYFFFFP